ncbi:MAG TPA: sugar kinase [Candidatus Dormibacteraeota bacterium]|nr:sugar kinase [Candidatus Dormibacteraeota bacterium]
MIDAITIGESMVLLDPTEDGPLDAVPGYRQRVAGAESNFAIALARLGLRAAWVSRLGADPFGRLIRRCMTSEGVEVHAVEDETSPTGIYFKERLAAERVMVYYYRTGSAASRLAPEDVPEGLVRRSRLLHFTGISLAVSGRLPEATLHAVALARRHGLLISFDPNLRPKLWGVDEARRSLGPVLRDLDLLLTGEREIQLLTGETDWRRLLRELHRRRIHIVVIKRGAAGALVASDERIVVVPPADVGRVVDSVGAGDAFNAGFVAGHLRGLDLEQCATLGGALGAAALAGTGDYETIPGWAEAKELAARVRVRELLEGEP